MMLTCTEIREMLIYVPGGSTAGFLLRETFSYGIFITMPFSAQRQYAKKRFTTGV